jgi:cell division protein FtsQ
VDRIKVMQRNASSAAEAERYRPELIADDEPRYLRRQKPLEIRRKKFSGKSWPFYRRLLLGIIIGAAAVTAGVEAARFLLYSPEILLLKPEQVEVVGNHYVTRDAVLGLFYGDRGRSVLRIPLDERRSQIEQIPWVESASVQRIFPNRVRVVLTERTPVAFLRSGSGLSLIDAYGVILDRRQDQDFQFPVITGVGENLSAAERAHRMEIYEEFIKELDLVRADSSEHVSEVDLSNPRDLRAVMANFPGASGTQAVAIHFGEDDFAGKYRLLADNFGQWQANAGCVQSVDLRFTHQVVLNPDANACGGQPVAGAKLQFRGNSK